MDWLPWLFGLALLAVVVLGARHFSEARDFAALIRQVEPWWMVLAVLFQAGTYVAQGEVYRSVARRARFPLRLPTASGLSLAKLFIDQALPSGGVSGTLVLASGLERRGMSRSSVAATIGVDIATYYSTFALCLAIAVVITSGLGEVGEIILIVSLVFITFCIVISTSVLLLAGRTSLATPRLLARIRPVRTALDFLENADVHLARSPRLLLGACAWHVGIIVLDSGTIWILIRALGGHGAMAGVFASFMISSLLRRVGISPGGLGVFEAASVLTLKMVGIPVAMALAATLLFRGLSFWLPMVPGLWLSRREVHRQRRPG